MMAQTVYTSAIWGGGYFLTPQDKRINQTRGVEEMNWGVEPPQPPGNSHTERGRIQGLPNFFQYPYYLRNG